MEVALIVVVFGSILWVISILFGPVSLPFQGRAETLQVVARLEDDRVVVTGTTTLPDGALIDWSVWRDPALDPSDLPGGQATVASGAFGFDTNIAGWVRGAAKAELSFSCDWGTVQPKQVTDLVGDHCEHLRGEQVYVDSPGDTQQLLVDVPFSVP